MSAIVIKVPDGKESDLTAEDRVRVREFFASTSGGKLLGKIMSVRENNSPKVNPEAGESNYVFLAGRISGIDLIISEITKSFRD